MSFKQELSRIAADVDKVLDEMLTPLPDHPREMMDIARYAALDAGKRLRAFLTVQTAGLFGAPYESALRAGACIEMVHNSSLIHDDLPCMDNDTVRRGRPSVWAKYGEWRAMLAGDLLLNWPFRILAIDEKISENAAVRAKLAEILSSSTQGMIDGQLMDKLAEQGEFQDQAGVNKIQSLKTGCMFNACTMFGATLGNASAEQRAALKKFTDAMGLCFQITDDILDAVGDPAQVGKTLGKDANKATYVKLVGVDGARAKAAELAALAKYALSIFDERADNLREMMDYMVSRES